MIDLLDRVDPWGAAMLRQMAYATVVFFVVAGIARWRATRSPNLLYAFWGLVLWRLLLPVDLASPIALATLAHRAFLDRGTVVSEPAMVEATGGVVLERSSDALGVTTSPIGLAGLLLAAWIAAGLFFAARSFGRRRPLVRLARRSPEVAGPVAACLLDRWRRRYGIRRPVRLVACDADEGGGIGPFTVGTWRPIVVVPSWIARRPQLLEATLAHELAHVRRFDDLRLLVQELVRAVWVLFPLVHVAVARMRRERERVCDHLATAPGRLSRRRYVAALRTILAGGLEPVRAVPGLGSTVSRSTAKRNRSMRFDALLTEPKRTTLRGGLLYVALVLLVLPMAPMVASAPASADEPPTSATAPSADVSSTASNRGADAVLATMVRPLESRRVTSPFGPRRDPFGGSELHHTGIDVKADASHALTAPADGVVELATTRWEGHEDWGTVVILDHGEGVRTVYAHLDSFTVEEGATVRRGQRIGAPGSTGKSTGPHLHFEIHRHGEPIDPASVITDWR